MLYVGWNLTAKLCFASSLTACRPFCSSPPDWIVSTSVPNTFYDSLTLHQPQSGGIILWKNEWAHEYLIVRPPSDPSTYQHITTTIHHSTPPTPAPPPSINRANWPWYLRILEWFLTFVSPSLSVCICIFIPCPLAVFIYAIVGAQGFRDLSQGIIRRAVEGANESSPR